jgi:hypothetical protein
MRFFEQDSIRVVRSCDQRGFFVRFVATADLRVLLGDHATRAALQMT